MEPKGLTLIGPIKLSLDAWHAYALSGLTTSNPDCPNLYTLSGLTVTDHRRQWAHVPAAAYCTRDKQLDIRSLQLQLGDVTLSIEHLKVAYQSSSPISLRDGTLSCGRLLPLSLNAKSGTLSRDQITLEDLTLTVGAVPLGWFSVLDVSRSGRAGLLPPSLAIQANRFRAGLPMYVPLSTFHDLTLTPGIELEASGNRLFSWAVYRWHQPSETPGTFELLGDQRFVSAHASGHARLGQWRMSTHGHTRFGVQALTADPNLSIENLSGFSRGQITLNWWQRNLTWGLAVDRSLSQAQAMDSFSRLHHHVELTKHLSFGKLGLGNTTQLRLEPTSVWLSQSTLAMFLNKRWWGLSAENHTHLDLQHSNRRPLSIGKGTDLGLGTLRSTLKLDSLWARQYETTTHTVGMRAFATAVVRNQASLSSLDTHLNPGARFNRRVSTGLTSIHEWSSLSTEVQVNTVHMGQSQHLNDNFGELDLRIDHRKAGLRATYAHQRSLFIDSKLMPTSALSLNTTYFARHAGIVPMDLLFVDVTKSEPTVGHHLRWHTRYSQLTGSIWLPQDHSSAHAAALGLTQRPECECFRWTTELKYIRQMANLWLTFQLELDLTSLQH